MFIGIFFILSMWCVVIASSHNHFTQTFVLNDFSVSMHDPIKTIYAVWDLFKSNHLYLFSPSMSSNNHLLGMAMTLKWSISVTLNSTTLTSDHNFPFRSSTFLTLTTSVLQTMDTGPTPFLLVFWPFSLDKPHGPSLKLLPLPLTHSFAPSQSSVLCQASQFQRAH